MSNPEKILFWKSKKGMLLQTVIALLPSILFLRSGTLLLFGLGISTLLAIIFLRLRNIKWKDIGLDSSLLSTKILWMAFIFSILLLPVTFYLRHVITKLTASPPNLEAFNSIKGNPTALITGLVVVWIFGAFCEEFFFRGFILNTLYDLLPAGEINGRTKWLIALSITSTLVGLGHSYQGITGMILTAVIGFIFGVIYLITKKNLWASIFTHGIYDTIAFIFVFYGLSLDKIL
jgi:membrane protease YdiL (CAAX protease family)